MGIARATMGEDEIYVYYEYCCKIGHSRPITAVDVGDPYNTPTTVL